MHVPERGACRLQRARARPERVLVGRELHGVRDAELPRELLHGLTALVGYERFDGRGDERGHTGAGNLTRRARPRQTGPSTPRNWARTAAPKHAVTGARGAARGGSLAPATTKCSLFTRRSTGRSRAP